MGAFTGVSATMQADLGGKEDKVLGGRTTATSRLPAQVSVRERYNAMQIALNRTGKAIAFSMCEWGVSNPWLYGSEVKAPPGHKRHHRAS